MYRVGLGMYGGGSSDSDTDEDDKDGADSGNVETERRRAASVNDDEGSSSQQQASSSRRREQQPTKVCSDSDLVVKTKYISFLKIGEPNQTTQDRWGVQSITWRRLRWPGDGQQCRRK